MLRNTDQGRRAISRVAIIDDHTAIIEMMTQIVDSIPGYQVVGSASEAMTGLALCQKTQPEVIVLDLVLPRFSGLSMLNRLQAACPNSHILIFSGCMNPSSVRGAVLAGVAGYIEKMSTLEEFRSAVLAVGSGRAYFSAGVSEIIKNIIRRNPAGLALRARLTPRENTVLGFLASGLSSKEIAAQLGVSVNTVSNHRSSLMKKTGLRRVAQLTLHAVQSGLVCEAPSTQPLSN